MGILSKWDSDSQTRLLNAELDPESLVSMPHTDCRVRVKLQLCSACEPSKLSANVGAWFMR